MFEQIKSAIASNKVVVFRTIRGKEDFIEEKLCSDIDIVTDGYNITMADDYKFNVDNIMYFEAHDMFFYSLNVDESVSFIFMQ